MNYFNSNLIFLREKNQLSKVEIAAKLGVSKQAITKLFRSENPQANTIIAISEIFNVSIDDLLLKDLSKEQN